MAISIILAVLGFGIIILVHELGHFITARLFKVTVNEFSIGMGPKLFSKKETAQFILCVPCRWAAMSVWQARKKKAMIPTLLTKRVPLPDS